ncbi:hypothetical protein L1987_01175 [Smallanthus sonchifolius]|uniref:Uncharacterized protein n=1 Tax=Smallanthus sonchifolius TaxID=185202 RepID=A0ACB9K4G2_9ASTR|nr:hypothetical protein L1987_01175 [Smallanthus sonchifolius]
MNRCEDVYNFLVHEVTHDKHLHNTRVDKEGNNLLHLAGELAPTDKLNMVKGAALQMQRELQWFQTGKAIYETSPRFIIFSVSDAISLFTSTTSLLMFQSILTSRYAEEDFLYKLPLRLILGLVMLLMSVATMMIAFNATLYILFGQEKSWILIPAAAITCLPIASFMRMQLPLLFDLISSTYGNGIFANLESCLTSATPSGLKSLREKELAILRGEGVSDKPREKKDRIYDYEVYNDLGDLDRDPNLARPVLGNKDYPHPRHCKTSRPPTKSVLKAAIPSPETTMIDKNLGFPYFTAIDSLFNEGVNLPPIKSDRFLKKVSSLTSATPSGLKSLREKELAILLGEGVSDKPREKKDRIYDYDVYNDLGDPDKDPDLARLVLGNKDYLHPRRYKTSRPPTKLDPLPESRSSDVYVPRDEAFS